MQDIKYEKLDSFKSDLDNRLGIYNQKMGSLIGLSNKNIKENVNKSSKISIKIDYKFILVFIVIGVIVYYTFKMISPEYIKKKELNKDTYFNEYVICNYKHRGFSFVITTILTAFSILGVYIYNTRK